jgi:hypothetical protein
MIWTTTRVETASMWTSGTLWMGVMLGIESLSLSLKSRSEIKFS